MTDFCEAVREDLDAAQAAAKPTATQKWTRNMLSTAGALGEIVVAALEANYVEGGRIRHLPYIAALEGYNNGPLHPIQLKLAVKWAAEYTNARAEDDLAGLRPAQQLLGLIRYLDAVQNNKDTTLDFYGYTG